MSHCELKKGAHKSAVNHQRKEVCWLSAHLLGFIVFTLRLTVENTRPESRSKEQRPDYTSPCQYLCALHSSQLHLEEIPKWFQHCSLQWLHGNSCGKVRECFCYEPFAPTRAVLLGSQVAQRSSLLDWKLYSCRIFSQDRFGFVSVWSCVKTALVTHLRRRWKDLCSQFEYTVIKLFRENFLVWKWNNHWIWTWIKISAPK